MFDGLQVVMPDPSHDAVRAALALLGDLLTEFHFLATTDKAAALSAIFAAVVRPLLSHAPAFHIRTRVLGSGKTYLCEFIGAFAGPGGNAKVRYPTTSEEASKVFFSLLLTSPAVIEFDDMNADWIPHGIIKRVLTAESVAERILGVSKAATVRTRTLFLGSDNNMGPVRNQLLLPWLAMTQIPVAGTGCSAYPRNQHQECMRFTPHAANRGWRSLRWLGPEMDRCATASKPLNA